ncbi:hypothetical protein DAPPUDRAFT_113205 [Daphnia pulex]|uniref:Uncharacterized protein n=1 Tax=Daphnia pulex TaxID=6669 RepID=E9HEC2_DAPPU|nr:hypothetical protein DAPPUDRAFT_113205 [Daphnia pulex]|eukprot:EFX69926.1 hypothetical protein DAPPUDRAFT_113205 [Daphnia pulex]
MQTFLESDFFELPAGIRCPNCWSFCYTTAKSRVKRTTTPTTNNRECLSCAKGCIPTMIQNRKKPINLFVVPPFTSTPTNFIITIQRQSRKNTIGAEALQLLRDFISTNEAMPHLSTHVQFIMPPIGSICSGLASYRDMNRALTDERETVYSPISDIMFMLTAVMRNGDDKVTLVASKMSSITCKPSNLMQLLEDFKEFNISPKNVSFVLGGFETQEGNLSCNPFSLNGEEMMTIFEKKENLPWVNELKLNCFARMFVDGLVSGRNTTKMLEVFLTPS